jgi:hypothetical protein
MTTADEHRAPTYAYMPSLTVEMGMGMGDQLRATRSSRLIAARTQARKQESNNKRRIINEEQLTKAIRSSRSMTRSGCADGIGRDMGLCRRYDDGCTKPGSWEDDPRGDDDAAVVGDGDAALEEDRVGVACVVVLLWRASSVTMVVRGRDQSAPSTRPT